MRSRLGNSSQSVEYSLFPLISILDFINKKALLFASLYFTVSQTSDKHPISKEFAIINYKDINNVSHLQAFNVKLQMRDILVVEISLFVHYHFNIRP